MQLPLIQCEVRPVRSLWAAEVTGIATSVRLPPQVYLLGWPRLPQICQYTEECGIGMRSKETTGAAAVSMMPRTKIYMNGFSLSGGPYADMGFSRLVLTICLG